MNDNNSVPVATTEPTVDDNLVKTEKSTYTKEQVLAALAKLEKLAKRKHRGRNPGAFGGRLKSLRKK